jgi:SpoVK/Ycf46/Vps4 family AAA+-type ATPase
MKKLKIYKTAQHARQASEKVDLIQVVKDAYSDIQECFLMQVKPIEELPKINAMSKLFNMSVSRAAVFAVIYCRSEHDVRLSEEGVISILRNYFDGQARNIRQEIKELKRLGLIERNREEGVFYFTIHPDIVQAIDDNDLEKVSKVGPKGLEESLDYFKKKLMDHDVLSRAEVEQLLDDIKDANPTLSVIRYCEQKNLFENVYDAYLCLAVCTKAALDQHHFDFSYLSSFITFSRCYLHILRHEVLEGTWAPIAEGLIENAGGNMVEYDPELRLTAKGYDFFLKELDPEYLKRIRLKVATVKTPMIQPKEIQKVNLHFDEDFALRTSRITELLKSASFAKYQASFPKNAKMKGLTMLFHGGPGCGKTEFALQLSRATGRPLMKVEVTDFQSKWVGESEKQLKQIFADYKMACDRMGSQMPILFFNECDQVIGRRVGIKSSVDQMTNALQNIILEEMENFKGILIGTTNLTANMDPAFERRWVMKMQFASPNETAKIAIWKSAIKGLRQAEAHELVKRFNFTPGEIANISRRFVIENMLGLTQSRLQTLIQLCETEHYDAHTSNKSIGFSFEKSFQQTAKAN